VSQDIHLVTRERPDAGVFVSAVRDAGGEDAEVTPGFDDPNGYVNISGPALWVEIEPPGHVEAADLEDMYTAAEVALPEPDDQQCLWLTVATIPAGAPDGSAEVTWTVFKDLASRYGGVAFSP
jgi:hypothetical protein